MSQQKRLQSEFISRVEGMGDAALLNLDQELLQAATAPITGTQRREIALQRGAIAAEIGRRNTREEPSQEILDAEAIKKVEASEDMLINSTSPADSLRGYDIRYQRLAEGAGDDFPPFSEWHQAAMGAAQAAAEALRKTTTAD